MCEPNGTKKKDLPGRCIQCGTSGRKGSPSKRLLHGQGKTTHNVNEEDKQITVLTFSALSSDDAQESPNLGKGRDSEVGVSIFAERSPSKNPYV